MRKKFLSLEAERVTNGLFNKAKDSVYDETLLEYKHSFVQDLGNFLGTMRMEENDISSILQRYDYIFETYETKPSTYEVTDFDNTSNLL